MPMLCKIRSLGLQGIQGYEVVAECDIHQGMPNFDIVGLPDAAVKEARERVRTAMKNSGFVFPVGRITINLAPANLKKVGTVYDLPILVGIMCAYREIFYEDKEAAFLGELSLSGDLHPVVGMLPMALAAKEAGIKRLFVPAESAKEAALVRDILVYPVKNIKELIKHLNNVENIPPCPPTEAYDETLNFPDFSEVKGQAQVKRVLEIAAAGSHNVCMVGPPGSGKSMLAKRLPSILPALTEREALEASAIHSAMGMFSDKIPMLMARPFRSPHHTISAVGMAGGGNPVPRPGEISLAHHGVLFLDELPEFHKDVLEVLRQPMEDGTIQIVRSAGSESFPAQFMLVTAMNPCKCGWYGHPGNRCRCTQKNVDSYLSKLSGPLLDRIDLFTEVQALEFDELSAKPTGEASEAIRQRVEEARKVQTERFAGTNILTNAQMGPKELQNHCTLEKEALDILRSAKDSLGITARSYDRILRLARSIADLDGDKTIGTHHVAEAVQYRAPSYLRR